MRITPSTVVSHYTKIQRQKSQKEVAPVLPIPRDLPKEKGKGGKIDVCA